MQTQKPARKPETKSSHKSPLRQYCTRAAAWRGFARTNHINQGVQSPQGSGDWIIVSNEVLSNQTRGKRCLFSTLPTNQENSTALTM